MSSLIFIPLWWNFFAGAAPLKIADSQMRVEPQRRKGAKVNKSEQPDFHPVVVEFLCRGISSENSNEG
ncbi:MAG: hypothetical protein U0694_28370 [Anaerolineae bacterium]